MSRLITIAALALAWGVAGVTAQEATGDSEDPIAAEAEFELGPWQRLTDRDPTREVHIATLEAVADDLYAAGSAGSFYRVEDGELRRIPTPTRKTMSVIWGRGPKDIYVAGADGVVCHYDGEEVAIVGEPIRTVQRRWRPGDAPTEREVNLKSLFSPAPGIVYAAGTPAALLRFDGEAWTEVTLGGHEFVVRGPKGRSLLAHPVIGPMWGSGVADIVVAKDESWAELARTGERFQPRHLRASDEFVVDLWHYDGSEWTQTDIQLSSEPSSRAGRSAYPEIRDTADGVYVRFENALHRWDDNGWKLVTTLPAPPEGDLWRFWAAADGPIFLIQGAEFQYYEDGVWHPVKGESTLGLDLALSDDGDVGVFAGDTILVCRLESRKSAAATPPDTRAAE